MAVVSATALRGLAKTCNVVCCAGTESPFAPSGVKGGAVAEYTPIAKMLGGQLVQIEGGTHFSPMEMPTAVAKIVARVMAQGNINRSRL